VDWRRSFPSRKIYGKGALHLTHFPQVPTYLPQSSVHDELRQRIDHVRRIVESLEAVPQISKTPLFGKRVFIGHGRSPLWRELKDFLAERLGLAWDEFNREPVAGYATSERLDTMLSQAAFAFLVMTAEEEHRDSTVHARPNVIHEDGLFQGRLGFSRAIVLLEDGCSEFSNITGLSEIRFPRGDISARFEDCRRVLQREHLL
jgi:predicted nucleotide-binding protein